MASKETKQLREQGTGRRRGASNGDVLFEPAHLEIVEFCLIGTPDRIVQAVVLAHQSQTFIRVVQVEIAPFAGFSVVVGSAPVKAFRDTLDRSDCSLVSENRNKTQQPYQLMSWGLGGGKGEETYIAPIFNGGVFATGSVDLGLGVLEA